jgi:aspartate racemase
MNKKTLGIIGGMGAPATSLFFDSIIKEFPCVDDRDYLEIFVHNNSKIPDRTAAILHQKESPLNEILRSAMLFDSLHVDYIVMACVTSYYYAKTIQERLKYSTIIDILSTTSEYINLNPNAVTKVGILASTGAIKTKLWQNELSKYSIESIILPDMYQEKYIMDTIYGTDGLKSGNLSQQNKNKIIMASNYLIEQGSQMILAGCSEIPMIINQEDVGVAFIDSFKVLRNKIYSNCYNAK